MATPTASPPPVPPYPNTHAVGTKVRSYDFPSSRTCYVEGIVDGYGGEVFPSDEHYRIRVTKRVWEGKEEPVPEREKFVYPPFFGWRGTRMVEQVE